MAAMLPTVILLTSIKLEMLPFVDVFARSRWPRLEDLGAHRLATKASTLQRFTTVGDLLQFLSYLDTHVHSNCSSALRVHHRDVFAVVSCCLVS